MEEKQTGVMEKTKFENRVESHLGANCGLFGPAGFRFTELKNSSPKLKLGSRNTKLPTGSKIDEVEFGVTDKPQYEF